MESINISLSEPFKQFVDGQISTGRYSSASEYVREPIRADEKRKAVGAAVKVSHFPPLRRLQTEPGQSLASLPTQSAAFQFDGWLTSPSAWWLKPGSASTA